MVDTPKQEPKTPKPLASIQKSRLLSEGDGIDRSGTPLRTRVASPCTLNPPIDSDGLSWPSLGARQRIEQTEEESKSRELRIAGAVRTILTELGEDPDREGLLETPERYARAMLFSPKDMRITFEM